MSCCDDVMQSCMLTVAKDLLEAEAALKAEERDKFLQDNCPPLDLPYSREELTELCQKLHDQINAGEEEKYGIEFKLSLVLNEVRDLNIKIVDLRGKFKKPKLKKVRMSADAMLKALLGSKHTVNMDLRSNLKQVKKEVKEEDQRNLLVWSKFRETFWSGQGSEKPSGLVQVQRNLLVWSRFRETFWSGPGSEKPSGLVQVQRNLLDKQLRDVGDWRKNIEDKSDRKKMFDS
ncbi:Troponin I, fast skeletal muscle [Merluccius polli]|uniref:Troponin I, fast skeletal muscle n=1 Tax=Merluccius polli TaxID=89951 RepID=A0AA47P7I8_MERPO|nr:Troponin I, fast skeletal muscle [Merluccius polli]